MKFTRWLLCLLVVPFLAGCLSKAPKSARPEDWDGPYIGGRPNPNYVAPAMDDMAEPAEDAEAVQAEAASEQPEPMPEPEADPTTMEDAAAPEPAPMMDEQTAVAEPEPVETVEVEPGVDEAMDAMVADEAVPAEQSLSDAMEDLEAAMGEGMESGNTSAAEGAAADAVAQAEAAIADLNQPIDVTEDALAVEVPEDMVAIASDAMDAMKYDSVMEVLTIQFKNGTVYEYLGVPQDVYDQFLSAESMGAFFTETIKPNYEAIMR